MWREKQDNAERGFMLQSSRLQFTVWSDNVNAYGHDKHQCIRMLDDLEEILRERSHCSFKGDERRVIYPCSYWPAPEAIVSERGHVWQVDNTMRCLGPIISSTGSPDPDLEQFEHSVGSAFYANARFLQNSLIPVSKRIARFDSIVCGMLLPRAPLWSPDRSTFERLDRLQNKFLLKMSDLRKAGEAETPQRFGMRQNKWLSTCEKRPWKVVAAQAIASWTAHLQRHPEETSTQAYSYHGWSWIQEQRATHSGSGLGVSRTYTRGSRGKIYRWDTGWAANLGLDGTRDKARLATAGEALLRAANATCRAL